MATITTGRFFSEARTISTGLKGKMAYNILSNVIGQLSDGIWENSRAMCHYWPYANISMNEDDSVDIVIDERWANARSGYCNKFKGMSPADIKDWFAKKAKAVVNNEAKDCPNRNLKFNKKNNEVLDYMYDHLNLDGNRDQIKVSDVYEVYKALRSK